MSACTHKKARLVASANGPRLVCPCGDSPIARDRPNTEPEGEIMSSKEQSEGAKVAALARAKVRAEIKKLNEATAEMKAKLSNRK